MTSNNMRPKRRMVLLELQENMNDKARFKLRSIKLDSLSSPKTISSYTRYESERNWVSGTRSQSDGGGYDLPATVRNCSRARVCIFTKLKNNK